jgi:NADPH:quinone reductase
MPNVPSFPPAVSWLSRKGRPSAHGAPRGGFAPVSAREAGERGVTVRGIEQVQYPPGRRTELLKDAHAALADRAAIGRP